MIGNKKIKEHGTNKSDLTDILIGHRAFNKPDPTHEPIKNNANANSNSNSKLALEDILMGNKPIKNQLDSKAELTDILIGDQRIYFN